MEKLIYDDVKITISETRNYSIGTFFSHADAFLDCVTVSAEYQPLKTFQMKFFEIVNKML